MLQYQPPVDIQIAEGPLQRPVLETHGNALSNPARMRKPRLPDGSHAIFPQDTGMAFECAPQGIKQDLRSNIETETCEIGRRIVPAFWMMAAIHAPSDREQRRLSRTPAFTFKQDTRQLALSRDQVVRPFQRDMRSRGRAHDAHRVIQCQRRDERVFPQPARRTIRSESMACVKVSRFRHPGARPASASLRLTSGNDPHAGCANGYVPACFRVGGIDALQPDDRKVSSGCFMSNRVRVQNSAFAAAVAAETSGPG